MAAPESANVRRTVAVLLLAALSIALWAPDLRRVFGHPLGVCGIVTSPDMRVIGVAPGSPAARANIHPRPYVDLQRMTPQDRVLLVIQQGETINPGQTLRIWLRDANRSYVANLTTVPEASRNIPTVVIRAVLALLLLFSGVLVVLRKPSIATWLFFLFSLTGGAAVNVSTMAGPLWFQAVANTVFQIVYVLSLFGGPAFALYLLHEGPISGWRRTVLFTIAVLAIAYAALFCFEIVSILNGSMPAAVQVITTALATLGTLSIPFILLATYSESAPSVRERLRWVIVGFTVFSITRCIDLLGFYGVTPVQLPYFTHSIVIAIGAFAVSFTVIYAVLKHRVLDVNVAFSRAVVYTILSAIIVGLFALVDLFFNRALSHSNAGYIADIALALILGFFFNTMHHHVDRIVDGLLFRSRHVAERHLATVLSAIPYAKSEEHVTELITEEPVRTLDLSGALVARTEHMNFDGAASLVAYLEGTRTALRPPDHGGLRAPLGFEPALAAPVFSHGDLVAIVFYGYHKNHTDLDQDEIALLERIAAAAGAAYDHLEAQALRQEVESLRAQLALVSAPQRLP